MLCVEADVIFYEGGNEVVAMVISFLQAESDWIVPVSTCFSEKLETKLPFQKSILRALVNQYWRFHAGCLHQFICIMSQPFFPVVAEIG